jgi:hypothetical protein
LDLWDGKKNQEYIVDNLLTDDRYVTVGDALPNLRRIAEQRTQSATTIPSLSAGYRREGKEEADLLLAGAH